MALPAFEEAPESLDLSVLSFDQLREAAELGKRTLQATQRFDDGTVAYHQANGPVHIPTAYSYFVPANGFNWTVSPNSVCPRAASGQRFCRTAEEANAGLQQFLEGTGFIIYSA